jgi:hypothetical protein
MTLVKTLATIALAMVCLPFACHADVLQTRSAGNITLPTNARTNVTILTMTLPAAGSYWAVAKASFINWTGQEDYLRCGLSMNGVSLDSAVTAAGGQIAPSAATVVTEAKVTTTLANQTLSVLCSHDHALAGIYVDGGASLVVTSSPAGPVGNMGVAGATGQTGPASSTTGICASVNASIPTSQSCSSMCAAGKLLSQVQAVGTCSVATQNNPCSANGYVGPYGVYTGACCVCHS